jgi:chemotaxis protein methyltransferase CheR
MGDHSATPAWETTENDAIELRLLLDAILLKYGYDFRDYSRASLKRRVQKRMQASHVTTISEMIHRVLQEPEFFDRLLGDLSINVTEMFRDPPFFRALREQVLPALAERPFLKIWHAGCATGEEVYSMAILLAEAGLIDRTRIIATDMSEAVITRAREGVYSLELMRDGTSQYQRSGGTGSFGDYYAAQYDSAIMVPDLRRNIVFAVHNLAVDGSIGEMDLVVCRNVLIYFNRDLQDRVASLFASSLAEDGFLCLGAKESIRFTGVSTLFEEFVHGRRIYRRRRDAGGEVA